MILFRGKILVLGALCVGLIGCDQANSNDPDVETVSSSSLAGPSQESSASVEAVLSSSSSASPAEVEGTSSVSVSSSSEYVQSSSSFVSSSSAEESSSSELSSSSVKGKGVVGQFVDERDGAIYDSVRIGTQTWMAENLRYKTQYGSWCKTDDSPVGKRDSTLFCSIFGRTYDWSTAMNTQISDHYNSHIFPDTLGNRQGICPAGWHLPSVPEWDTLFSYAGGSNIAGKYLKSDTLWATDGVHTNEDFFGFNALPGGHYDPNYYTSVYRQAGWWTASQEGAEFAMAAYVEYYGDFGGISDWAKGFGFSVRCVKDEE